MDRFEQITTLLRQGHDDTADRLHAADPDAWLPRWTAGDPLSPALRLSTQVHNTIIATRLDDTWAWVLTGDHVVRIARTGGQIHRTPLAGDHVYRPAGVFHHDTAVMLEHDRIRVFDLATGAQLLATDPDDIPRPAGDMVRIAVTGHTAVTGTTNGYLLHWDLTGGRLLARTHAHGDADTTDAFVTRVAISPGNHPIVLSLGGHPRCTVAFHNLDGLRHTASADVPEDTTIGYWTSQGAVTVSTEAAPNTPTSCPASQGAPTVDQLTFWDPATATALNGHPVPAGNGLASLPLAAVPAAGGTRFLAGTGSALQIVDPHDATVHGTVRTDFRFGISHAAVHGRTVLAAQGSSTEGRINLLELTDPLPHDTPGRTSLLGATPIILDGRATILTVTGNGLRHAYDLDGKPLTIPTGKPTDEYGYVGGHPRLAADDHGRLAIMNHLKPVLIDLTTGHTRHGDPLGPDRSILWGLALHDTTLAALTIGGTLAVWDTDTLTPRAQVKIGTAQQATTITLADIDGQTTVLAGFQNGAVRRFDAHDLTETTPPGVPDTTGIDTDDIPGIHGPDAVRSLHTAGPILITAIAATVTSTDLRTGEPAGPPLTHPAPVRESRPFLLDDGTLAVVTDGTDNRLRIWDVTTGETVRTVPMPHEPYRILNASTDRIVIQDRGHLIALGPRTRQSPLRF
ncbi:hypothetical protein [Actinoplanes sp. HUAS TT8]|uniref:hypothetical protein n=1 Tax=Actinoplanes sp. HUAS TT8 TaxID=3447453 RepID=UPI003F524FEE